MTNKKLQMNNKISKIENIHLAQYLCIYKFLPLYFSFIIRYFQFVIRYALYAIN